jgi:hypothetical protein
MDDQYNTKGVKTRLFGVILIILGTLDSLLALRGGFTLNSFYGALIALGIFLYAIGAVRGGQQSTESQGASE